MRVVLDTNVVVSALLFPGGGLGWLPPLWTAARIRPLLSRATAAELLRVLSYPKFRLEPLEIEAVLAAYLPFAETVNPGSVPAGGLVVRCRDLFDQAFLDAAFTGHAAVLVTGDADLLALAGEAPFAIEPPARFRRRF